MASFREHFQIRNFMCWYPRADVFYQSQWNIPPVVFVVYRVSVATYCTTWFFLASTLMFHDIYPFPVYLTYWAYFILCCHLVLAAFIAIMHTHKSTNHCFTKRPLPLDNNIYTNQESVRIDASQDQPISNEIIYSRENSRDTDITDSECNDDERVIIKIKEPDSTRTAVRWYMKLDWILFSISCPLAVTVTTVYFYKVYPQVLKHLGKTVPDVDDLHVHGINTVVVVMEMALSAIPVRLLHFCYPVIYSVLYIISTAIFWSLDHSRILYGGLVNWNNPSRTILICSILGFAALPLIHVVFFGLYRLKVYLHERLSK